MIFGEAGKQLVSVGVGAPKWNIGLDRGGERSTLSGRELGAQTREQTDRQSWLALLETREVGAILLAAQGSRVEGTTVHWATTQYCTWQSGEVQAAKGTAERGDFLIGETALVNRARYVPCTRTALDWADTADLPSTTACLQVSRYLASQEFVCLEVVSGCF